MHHRIYKEVRKKLGRVLLSSPLEMEDILAVCIISLFGADPSVSQTTKLCYSKQLINLQYGPDYIDRYTKCARHDLHVI